jgi:hypothetical protein
MGITAERAKRSNVLLFGSPREQPELDRQLTLYHYERAMEPGESAFAVAALEKKVFGHSSVMVAMLSNANGRHAVLYAVRRSPDGFVFRRLHPDGEGEMVRALFDAATVSDFRSLAELGLSYAELGALTGRSRDGLRKALRKV